MMQTAFRPTRFSALFFGQVFGAGATGAASLPVRPVNLGALLTQADGLPPAELVRLFAGLAVRHQGVEFSTADSCATALNILSGNVDAATSPVQAERWALEWLDRLDGNMASVMRDVRMALASDDGDGQGRFFAARVRDVLALVGAVDRQAFAAEVLARFQD